MSEKEKMKNEELEQVAGGKFGKINEFEDATCQFCNKQFKMPKRRSDEFSGESDEDMDRHRWLMNTCPECRESQKFDSPAMAYSTEIPKN